MKTRIYLCLKMIVPISFIALIWSCKVEHSYTVTYIYENNTNSSVTVKSYCAEYTSEGLLTKDSIFVIDPHNNHTIVRTSESFFREPFDWFSNPGLLDSTIVEKDGIEIIHRRKDNDKLYDWNKYELIRSENYVRKYRFVFDEGFFDIE